MFCVKMIIQLQNEVHVFATFKIHLKSLNQLLHHKMLHYGSKSSEV